MPRNLKIIWLRNLYSSQIWQKPPIEQLIHNHAIYLHLSFCGWEEEIRAGNETKAQRSQKKENYPDDYEEKIGSRTGKIVNPMKSYLLTLRLLCWYYWLANSRKSIWKISG
jgi:hypothetical protein